jgi:hypothetical protein
MLEEPQNPGRANQAVLEGENLGVLVGWTHVSVSGRLILTIETARSAKDNRPQDIQSHKLLMTEN